MFLMSIRQVLQNIECFCDRLNNQTNFNDSDLPPWFCQGPSCLWRRWDRALTPPGSLVWPPPLPPDCRALAFCCWSDWWSRDRRIPAGHHCSLKACSVPEGGETPVNIINYKNLTSYHLLTVNDILKKTCPIFYSWINNLLNVNILIIRLFPVQLISHVQLCNSGEPLCSGGYMDCRPGFFKQSLSSVAIVGHIYTYIFDDNILTLTFISATVIWMLQSVRLTVMKETCF